MANKPESALESEFWENEKNIYADSKELEIDGSYIKYVLKGSETNPVLLMLHGLGSSLQGWYLNITALEKHFRLVLVDFRGFGKSDKKVGPFDIAQHSSDILRLIDHLELTSFHLLGFSMGGAIAINTALKCREKLKSLIIVNSIASFIPKSCMNQLEYGFRIFGLKILGAHFIAKVISNRIFPDDEQAHLKRLFLQTYPLTPTEVFIDVLESMKRFSVLDELADGVLGDLPALVICSTRDYSPKEEKQRFASLLPNAQYLEHHTSRHALPMDSPDFFNETVINYLKDTSTLLNGAVWARKEYYGQIHQGK